MNNVKQSVLLALMLTMFTNVFSQVSKPLSGSAFVPTQEYYYLRTVFTGDELSLESNGSTSNYMDGATFMSPQKGGPTGTRWKFVPDTKNKGWFRLKSKDQGEGKCLEANGAGGLKGGRSFMNSCQDVTGQMWQLELVSSKEGDNTYRLRCMAYGKTHSLEGNKMDNKAVFKGNSFMDKTQNVSGQMWRLIPVK